MNGMTRVRIVTMGVLAMAVVPLSWALGADWPQFRYDARRGAASPEELPGKLHLRWVRDCPPPRPAFPGELRLRYDASYEPVVLGKSMFVPSMVTDSVAALDTDTGGQRWCFFADGPVRFAPVAWQDKVYFVSDDGYLYCLDAAGGELRWRFRGLPEGRQDRKLIGNRRLISLYPARGGPVLADGTVYFAAGIWPSAGVFLYALDAETGRVVWSNTDSHHLDKANLDHGVQSPAGLTPQGYLTVLGEKLVVPSGAQLPGFLDRNTGKLERYTTGWGGRVGLAKGSWLVAGAGNYLLHSGDLYDVTRPNDEQFRNARGRTDFKSLLYPGSYTRLQIEPTCQRSLGPFRQPVFAEDVMYRNTLDGHIAAYDLTALKMEPRTASNTPNYRRSDEYPDKWLGEFPELWHVDSKLTVHIKAGSRIYAAGPGIVEAIDIPAAGGDAKVSWHAKFDGTPNRLLAADGKLFVVTLEGRIYAFSGGDKAEPIVHKRANSRPATLRDAWAEKAAGLLEKTGIREGYALVLGIGTGRLAEELARQSRLTVIGIDADAGKVAAARRRFHKAGLYGTRITVHQGDPLAYPFPPYLASLIVTEDPGALPASRDARLVEWLFHPLRPYGGTACLPLAAGEQEALAGKAAKSNLPGAIVRRTVDLFLLTRGGPLPGAADWSHEGAVAANTAASEDQFVDAPLDLLWFDGSIRWHRKPGNNTVRVAGGRLLVRSATLRALDVYTGRPLWETALPAAGGAQAPGDLVAVDDAIYAAAGRTCCVLNPVTGEKLREISIPPEVAKKASGNWSSLRVQGDNLVAAVGNHVMCMNRQSGKLRWSFAAQHGRLSLAVGGGKVFCAELPKPPNKRGESPKFEEARTVALDLQDGRVLWEVARGSDLHYGEAADLLVSAEGVYQGKDGKRVGDSYAAWCVAGDRMICGPSPEWIEIFDLKRLARLGDPLQWFRRGCTTLRASHNLVTTRFGGNAAYVDLDTRQITPVWNIRSACHNNLFPADGVLNMPNLTGGCTCNYTPASLALVPASVIPRDSAGIPLPSGE